MLLIVFLGLIAELTSVSGDCVIGKQDVNLIWNAFSGNRVWYFRLATNGSFDGKFRCVARKYESPVRNISQITFTANHKIKSTPVKILGYATNCNSTSWEETYPEETSMNGRNYPIAVDYNRYIIYKSCLSKSNKLDVLVAYRKPFPDKETEKEVKEILEKNKIEYSQLVDLPMENCNFTHLSNEDGNSQ